MPKNNLIKRLDSLDVFRGITITLMILVNSPGNQFAYSWLTHSAWNGCSLADLVFPFFIVIVGISSVIALTNLKMAGFANQQLVSLIIKRSIYIFSLGLLLNILPNHFDFSQIRFLGVLQRIAICYCCAAILFLTTRISTQIIILAVLLLSYWLLMNEFLAISLLSIDNNLVGYLDQHVFSPGHLYTSRFDPEGLLSTLPAISSALLGNIAGFILLSLPTPQQRLRWLIITGSILAVLGLIWSYTFPFNKLLWSSSYVLWTGGLGLLIFAFCYVLIEIKHIVNWAKPFILLGKNAMLVYILHVVFLKIQAIILVQHTNGKLINLRFYLTDLFFGHFSAKTASLSYAIGYTLFWLLILKCLNQWRLRRLSKPNLLVN